MADAAAAALVVFRDVIANWWKELRLPASSLCPHIGNEERSSDRLEK